MVHVLTAAFLGMAMALALYSFERGQTDPPKRLEPEGFDTLMQDLGSRRMAVMCCFPAIAAARAGWVRARALAPGIEKGAHK